MNWKRILRWVGVAIGTLVVLVLILAYMVNHNGALHRYLLAKAIAAVETSTGTKLQVGEYQIHWGNLGVHLGDVTVHGTETSSDHPLARAKSLDSSLRWRSLLRLKPSIRELILENPSISVWIDSNGNSNIPHPPKPSASKTDVFDLAIGHVAIRNGEIRYNDQVRDLNADLADVYAEIHHEWLKQEYSGKLGYENGVIAQGGSKPLHHHLAVEFSGLRSGIQFQRVELTTPESHFALQGSLENYANPKLQATYQGQVATADVRTLLQAASVPIGFLNLDGKLEYVTSERPAIENVTLNGRLSSTRMDLNSSGTNVRLADLSASYQLRDGNFNSNDIKAQLLGGSAAAQFNVQGLAQTPHYKAGVVLRQISLEQASRAKGNRRLFIRGTMNGQAQLTWVAAMQDLLVKSDAEINGALKTDTVDQSAGQAQGQTAATNQENWTPLNGSLHVNYRGNDQQISVHDSSLQTEHTSIHADGDLSPRSALTFEAKSSDLAEVDLLALTLRAATASPREAAPELLGLHGLAQLTGSAKGRTKQSRVFAQLEADKLSVKSTYWQHIQSNINADPSSVTVDHGYAITSGNGRIDFSGTLGLNKWAFSMSNPIQMQVHAANAQFAEIQKAADITYPITGVLSADIALHGTGTNPQGHGTIHLVRGSAWGEEIKNATVNFQGTNETLHAEASVQANAGNVSGQGDYRPRDKAFQFQLNVAQTQIDQIHNVASRGYPVSGTVTAAVKGQGTVDNPQLAVNMTIDQLQYHAEPLGQMRLDARLTEHLAKFSVVSVMQAGDIQANGQIATQGDYQAHATFEAQTVQFGPLLASFSKSPPQDLHGEVGFKGTLDGPLKDIDHLEVSVEIPRLAVYYRDISLANASPMLFQYQAGVVNIDRAEIKGSGTDFTVKGAVPVIGAGNFNASGSGIVDFKALTFLGPDVQASGTATLDVKASGNLKNPNFVGNVAVKNVNYSSDSAPVGVADLNGAMVITSDRVTVQNLQGKVSGGEVSAAGFVSYRPNVYANLQVRGNSVRIRYPQGTRALLNADISVSGQPDGSVMNGQMTIERLSFTKDFDLANFLGQFSGPESATTPAAWEQKMKLNVGVQSTDELALSSSKLSAQGSVNLRVVGTLADPVVLGRTNVTGGEVFFLGNRYEIQSGTVMFANRTHTEPTLNLYVSTQIQEYNITVNFVGPVDRLRTTYISDPALPPVDIINLLAFGKTAAESASSPSTPATVGAESVVAQGLSSQVSGRLEKFAGVSQLQIDPLIGGDTANPGARLAIQQHLTNNLLFTFSTDVTNTQEEVIQLKYQTKRKLALSVTRDEYGGYAVEAHIRKSF
jgi:translocation and assembly module TamB